VKHFLQIASGIDVTSIGLALQIHPELWDIHNDRKEFDQSSHAGTSDIWVRYNDPANLAQGYDKYTSEHDSVWHPAYSKLPQLRPIIFGLMAKCEAVRLGGVLITRIPPGGHILPHADSGWHPEYYNVKLYVPIFSNPHCVNRVGDEYVIMAPGDCWYFDNLKEHEVINNGDTERVTLIICLRCD
jgi:hypothetical protein